MIIGKPIEVQIFQDKITVLSYPGAMPPVDTQIIHHQKIVARDYRNRRIGDFLKELDLTEGRGTGFPKMNKKMENNGSPQPIIETDELGVYFMVTLPINLEYVKYMSDQVNDQVSNQVNNLIFNSLEEIIVFSNQVGNQVGDQVSDQVSDQANDQANDQVQDILNNQLHSRVKEILNTATRWIKRDELFEAINLSNHPKHRKKYLDPLLKIGWVEMEFPDKRTSPNQRYRITASGKNLLKLIK
jgi:ATP-dependent DNA helicase RecG